MAVPSIRCPGLENRCGKAATKEEDIHHGDAEFAEFGVFFYENYFAPRLGAESRESLKTQKIGAVRFVEFAPRLW